MSKKKLSDMTSIKIQILIQPSSDTSSLEMDTAPTPIREMQTGTGLNTDYKLDALEVEKIR